MRDFFETIAVFLVIATIPLAMIGITWAVPLWIIEWMFEVPRAGLVANWCFGIGLASLIVNVLTRMVIE